MSIYTTTKYYVYQLRLETSEEPFYIGKGSDRRITNHLQKKSLEIKSYKNNVIKKALSSGVIIISEKLHENLTEIEAFDLEISYIAMYGRSDTETGILTNHTDGGDGISGYRHTEESKLKIGDGHRGELHYLYGKKMPENQYEKIRKSNTGKTRSLEVKKILSLSKMGDKNPNYGKIGTPEFRAKMSIVTSGVNNPNYGKSMSEEQKEKIRQKKLGSKHSEETKLKISIGNKGKTLSWNASHCSVESKETVWMKADELYKLFIVGYNTKDKLSHPTKINRSKLIVIVDKFKSGWIPIDDINWVKWKSDYPVNVNN